MSQVNFQKQSEVIYSHWVNGVWRYPCCKSEVISPAQITNPGEDYTQIYCPYGCGYNEIQKREDVNRN